MKYMIASDIHGSAYYCRQLLALFEQEQADRLLLLGDILYHGPRNPLPPEYNTRAVADMLNEKKQKIFCVRGNCDTEVDQMMLEFPMMADYCVLATPKRLIYATHGHHFNTSSLPPLQPGDVLLHGHTHIPAWETFGDDHLYLNPGSISIPKDNSPHSYMVLEGTDVLWKRSDGTVFHSLSL